MSDSEGVSSQSSISVTSTRDGASIHSTISGDSQLDDHRHQSMSLPIRTESKASFPVPGDRTSKNYNRKNSHDSSNSMKPLKPLVEPRPSKVVLNHSLNSSELRNKMVVDDDDDSYDEYAVKFNDRYRSDASSNALSFANNPSTPAPIPVPGKRRSSKVRSRSFSDQVKLFIRPKEDSVTGGILLPNNSNANAIVNNHSNVNLVNQRDEMKSNDSISVKNVSILNNNLSKTISRASTKSERKTRSKDMNDPNDSDLDSHASRESQETEEDVCFPMLPEHIRVRGIDFGEIEEFIAEQRQENELISKREKEIRLNGNNSVTTSSEKFSSAALKYTPKFANSSSSASQKSAAEITTDKIENASTYSSDKPPNVTFNPSENKFENESMNLPTRFSFFSSEREETIHAPDITSIIEPGEHFSELFEPEDSVWWLDCICPTDNEMKMLAKAFAIHPLTAEDIRMQETREKVELFKNYYFVCFHTFETDSESEDFLEPINVYMVVFRQGMLTFHFSPIVNPANVRRRVRQLRDYVNVSADWLCYAMIDDITDGFAPIIHAIEYEADAIEDSVFLSRQNDFGPMLLKIGESRRKVMTLMRLLQGKADVIKMFAKRCQDEASRVPNAGGQPAQPRADIALYLGDIQDHIITMFQSLLSYEKIFSRSHSNYLAQLQVESFYSNNQVTDMLSKVTLLGTILVPMNLVTGLFGMNVRVPGEGGSNYGWFGGILGFIVLMIILSAIGANLYIKWVNNRTTDSLSNAISIRNFRFGGRRKREESRTRDRTDRSMISLPTRLTRYGEY